MSCSFGGRRVALIVSDGRIVIREKAVKDDIASFPPCGALSISLNGKTSHLSLDHSFLKLKGILFFTSWTFL